MESMGANELLQSKKALIWQTLKFYAGVSDWPFSIHDWVYIRHGLELRLECVGYMQISVKMSLGPLKTSTYSFEKLLSYS